VKQELLTLLEHLSSPPVFSGVHVTRSLALYVCFVDRCLSFCTFVLAIVLSVLLRYTISDCSFGIFKLFFVGLLACSIKMSGSKPKLKVRTLDEMFKKISESSEEK
jgi:hypothetical protein